MTKYVVRQFRGNSSQAESEFTHYRLWAAQQTVNIWKRRNPEAIITITMEGDDDSVVA